ncbi:hypothetical protein [Actinoplanes philippinensis]|uniref:hypothetical protein n=1 Tax=Actinoplanes philippinensis TaxID=35752 RepID=UPI0033CE3E80
MSKSTRSGGSGRRSGTVTVIEQRLHRTAAENARFAFILTAVVVGLLALVVAADHMHPLLAAFVAVPVAAAVGGLVWTLVRIWPVLRVLWWWSPEITTTVVLAWAWTLLATNTPGLITLAVLFTVVGLPAAFTKSRQMVVALFWCVAVRHRLRVCFSQFLVANRSGSLPLILFSKPTPVGERVWVMLRPGLSLSYLAREDQLGRIAVACHAASVTVDTAGTRSSAFVRFDIKRREVLTAEVSSPLVELIDPTTPLADKQPATVTGLDLPDVDDPNTTATASANTAKTPSANGKRPTPPADSADDEINQWI